MGLFGTGDGTEKPNNLFGTANWKPNKKQSTLKLTPHTTKPKPASRESETPEERDYRLGYALVWFGPNPETGEPDMFAGDRRIPSHVDAWLEWEEQAVREGRPGFDQEGLAQSRIAARRWKERYGK